MSETAVIIGSSTGIGRALAEIHRDRGIECITFSRKPEALKDFTTYELDLTDEEEAQLVFEKAFSNHPNIETIFLISGTGDTEKTPDYKTAQSTIALNCGGFALAAYCAANFLEKRGSGSLVAVTSVAAIRGSSQSLSYNASKAFQSSLLEGLRCRFWKTKLPITVTEIRAGFVKTAMMKAEKTFWVATADQAASSIFSAAQSRKNLVYILGRWRIIGWLLRSLPISLYKRIG
ncbi:MAG: SDR family NAD(P)-dependent oxidoreductase [Opitutaceae bacterium]